MDTKGSNVEQVRLGQQGRTCSFERKQQFRPCVAQQSRLANTVACSRWANQKLAFYFEVDSWDSMSSETTKQINIMYNLLLGSYSIMMCVAAANIAPMDRELSHHHSKECHHYKSHSQLAIWLQSLLLLLHRIYLCHLHCQSEI